MNFLWHTALSVFDKSSSLVYRLLGRDLDENDMRLMENLFQSISYLASIRTKLDEGSLLTSCGYITSNNNNTNLVHNDEQNCAQLVAWLRSLKKGKDLLLVTNKSNGYNIIQAILVELFDHSIYLIRTETENFEEGFNVLQTRIEIFFALLEYGCDPNRGLSIRNKKKLIVAQNPVISSLNTYLEDEEDYDEEEEVSEDATLVTWRTNKKNDATLTNIEAAFYANRLLLLSGQTKKNIVDKRTQFMSPLSPLTNLTSKWRDASTISSSSSSEMFFEQKDQEERKEEEDASKFPIDTPLLLLTCLFNKHNLNCSSNTENGAIRKTKKKTKRYVEKEKKEEEEEEEMSDKNRSDLNAEYFSMMPISSNATKSKTLFKRRHTVYAVNKSERLPNKNLIYRHRRNSFDLTKDSSTLKEAHHGQTWPSLLNYKKTELSFSSSYSSSSSFSSYSSGQNSDINSLKPNQIKELNNSFNITNPIEKNMYKNLGNENDSFDYLNKQSSSSSSSSSCSETESSLESSEFDEDKEEEDVNETTLATVYNYELDDEDVEQSYFNKYDLDINSKLFGGNSLSTSVFSIPSSSIKASLSASPTIISKSNSTTLPVGDGKSKQEEYCSSKMYAMLNKNRLKILDLLLKYGADKYLVGKISIGNMKKLNKKSMSMLSKWYGKTNDNINNEELRALSPIMASLCLDDAEVFSRLHKHHQLLFNYFRPDEDQDLIFYAIRFQATNCLVYLLSQSLQSDIGLDMSLSKIMFYILENTRSPKIITVLLNSGFDLSKRDFCGDTALHCLFKNTVNKLDEFQTPRNLSRILFKLLKYANGMKVLVNTFNGAGRVCMQTLFEWTELCDTVFFNDLFKMKKKKKDQHEWKSELEYCIRLLIRSGADLLPSNHSNCVDTLLSSILLLSNKFEEEVKTKQDDLKKDGSKDDFTYDEDNEEKQITEQILKRRSSSSTSSNSIGNNKFIMSAKSSNVSESESVYTLIHDQQKRIQVAKRIDAKYLLYLLDKVLNLSKYCADLRKQKSSMHYYAKCKTRSKSFSEEILELENNNNSNTTADQHHESLVSKFIQILFNVYVENFNACFEIIKLLTKFETELNELFYAGNREPFVPSNLVKKLLTHWILVPNFLSSNKQFEKDSFVKCILVHLIKNKYINLNDTCTQFNFETGIHVSANLLNHCYSLIELSKTGYQLERVQELIRLLLQHGANPNLEPYDATQSSLATFELNARHMHECAHFKHFNSCAHMIRKSNCLLARLCNMNRFSSPMMSPFNLKRRHFSSSSHQNHHHHRHHNYFNDYFNNKYYRSLGKLEQQNHESKYTSLDSQLPVYSSEMAENYTYFKRLNNIYNTSRITSCNSDQAVLLLTPSPSYESFISSITSVNSNNILIDSSILLLNYYKSIVKLLFDAMETEKIKKCLTPADSDIEAETKITTQELPRVYCTNHHQNHHTHQYSNSIYESSTVSLEYFQSLNGETAVTSNKSNAYRLVKSTPKLYEIESLNMYLNRLVNTPKSLKSITRRHILAKLTDSSNSNSCLTSIDTVNQVNKLKLPKRVRDFLLFNE